MYSIYAFIYASISFGRTAVCTTFLGIRVRERSLSPAVRVGSCNGHNFVVVVVILAVEIHVRVTSNDEFNRRNANELCWGLGKRELAKNYARETNAAYSTPSVSFRNAASCTADNVLNVARKSRLLGELLYRAHDTCGNNGTGDYARHVFRSPLLPFGFVATT